MPPNPGQAVAAVLLLTAVCTAALRTTSNPTFESCLEAINASRAVLPGSAPYDYARSIFNARFDPRPAAVYYAHSTEEVSQAVLCAAAVNVSISPAGGRQSFQGWNVPDGYLVVDVSNMTEVSWKDDNSTVTLGAGNYGAKVQTAVHDRGIPGAAVPGGFCSYVGVAGWTLGGGFGVLGRYLGLGCDQLAGLELVLANGTAVWATEEQHPDLFWASCGSGGGNFGVATAFEYKITRLPNDGRVTEVQIAYAPGNATVEAFLAFQDVLPTLDRRFGFVFGLSGGLSLTGLFLGTVQEALEGLEEAGLLQPSLLSPEVAYFDSEVFGLYPTGLGLNSLNSTWEFVAQNVPMWSGPAFNQSVPWGPEGFTGAPEQFAWIWGTMHAQAPGTHPQGGQGYNGWHSARSRLIGPLSHEAAEAVVAYADGVSELCASSTPGTLEQIACTFNLGGHVLQGAYAARLPNATAFPWRDRYFVLDATVQLNWAIPLAYPSAGLYADGLTQGYLDTLKPFLADQGPEAAYINYMLPKLENWQEGYYGSNYPRLQAIKSAYDPQGLFTKPYGVEGEPSTA